jgi:hypothetical protein
VVLLLACMALVAGPVLTAEAAACASGGPQCSGGKSGGHESSKGQTASAVADPAATSRDHPPAATDHAVDPNEVPNGGNAGSQGAAGTGGGNGTSSPGHHGPGGASTAPGHKDPGGGSSVPGQKDPGGGSSAAGDGSSGRPRHSSARPAQPRGRSATTDPVVPASGAIGRIERASADVRDAATGSRGTPSAVTLHSPRARRPDGPGVAATVEQVTGALRFPASLLVVIVLFLALQQRADGRDPKLANAPIASRQETLEFR